MRSVPSIRMRSVPLIRRIQRVSQWRIPITRIMVDHGSVLDQCWANVRDVGPALIQRWADVSRDLGPAECPCIHVTAGGGGGGVDVGLPQGVTSNHISLNLSIDPLSVKRDFEFWSVSPRPCGLSFINNVCMIFFYFSVLVLSLSTYYYLIQYMSTWSITNFKILILDVHFKLARLILCWNGIKTKYGSFVKLWLGTDSRPYFLHLFVPLNLFFKLSNDYDSRTSSNYNLIKPQY